jgi:hypothetical protein
LSRQTVGWSVIPHPPLSTALDLYSGLQGKRSAHSPLCEVKERRGEAREERKDRKGREEKRGEERRGTRGKGREAREERKGKRGKGREERNRKRADERRGK